jgi:hypothetical protein
MLITPNKWERYTAEHIIYIAKKAVHLNIYEPDKLFHLAYGLCIENTNKYRTQSYWQPDINSYSNFRSTKCLNYNTFLGPHCINEFS